MVVLDLAAVVDRQALEKAINEAEVLRVFDLRAVDAALERPGARRGSAALRTTLTNLDPLQARTRFELERRFLSLCRAAGLPPPEVNAWIEVLDQHLEADFLWRDQRLIVETDGYAVHTTRRAFRRDRRRNRLLTQAGWRTLRFTWEDVVDEPNEVAASIRSLLAAG